MACCRLIPVNQFTTFSQQSEETVQIDLVGRIRHTSLPISKPLLPLFEAIVNSIDAIEDGSVKNGNIEISINRDITQGQLLGEDNLRPVVGFTIEDNGIGFNDKNFESFQTADTLIKISRGGRGIGRFLWLKAFSSVTISSVFKENGTYQKRQFDFRLSQGGVEKHLVNPTSEKALKTTVTLKDFYDNFKNACPKRIDIIAEKILEHFFVYFLFDHCPRVTLVDSNNGERIELNERFNIVTRSKRETENFSLNKHDFKLDLIKLYGFPGQHLLHYCANLREVRQHRLSQYLPDLEIKMSDTNGEEFILAAYLSGEYLDGIANPERTDFGFIGTNGYIFDNEISEDELLKKVLDIIGKKIEPNLKNIREEKLQQIKKHIQDISPQFKQIIKYKPEELEKISPQLSLNKEKLDLELYKIQHKLDIETKQEAYEIIQKIDTIKDFSQYKEQYEKEIKKIMDVGMSKLSEYVLHRKVILELLGKSLQRQDNNNYSLESSIHSIVFPLRFTSDEISFENQNLWIIDEKLSYHNYLASDIEFNKQDIVQIDDPKRPDIIIYKTGFAFVNDEAPHNAIVILEFKRPMRKGYPDDENPIDQVYGYVRKILDGKQLDKKGRPIMIHQNTPFYAYILCDLTPKIKDFAELSNLIESPDSLGYFGYNNKYRTYIEIISYTKLLNDARQRNKMLFDKLNLL